MTTTIHNCIIQLLAKFSFFTEKNFGTMVIGEMIGYFTTQFSSFIVSSIHMALETVMVPRLVQDEVEDDGDEELDEKKEQKDKKEVKKVVNLAMSAANDDATDLKQVQLDKRVQSKLPYFLLFVADSVHGKELYSAFRQESFLLSCIDF